MPTIQLTDDLGLDADVKLAPFSALQKYFQQLTALRLTSGDLSKAGGFSLADPALTMLNTGLSFDKTVVAGPGTNTLSILAGVHGALELIRRTPTVASLPDLHCGDIPIADGTCYLKMGIQASVGPADAVTSGLLQFGAAPGVSLEIRNYRKLSLNQGLMLLDAVKQTIGNFLIPATVDDLASLDEGCVATVSAAGSLRLSGTANLLAVTNPLATAALPSPLPTLSVTAGGTAQVGASIEVKCTFQIGAQATAPGHVRIGWYRETDTELEVTAKVSEGISAGFGTTDLFSALIGVISANPSADLAELQKAGLSPAQVEAIQGAVDAAAARKLELALSAEISQTQSGDAMFLYGVDFAALTDASRQALDDALRGDLSGLHAGALPGITLVQSAWERARRNQVRFDVNLLGILNFGSVSSLAVSGSVLVEAATGALVLTDKATAQRIQSTAVNFGADTQKLRHVMAESFLLTAVYKGLQRQVGGPDLRCHYDFFDLSNDAGRDQMARYLRIGAALGLWTSDDAVPPAGIDDFGRSTIHAMTDYDNTLATGLFLDAGGGSVPQQYYENAGRAAIQLLVSEGDVDEVRRTPAIDDNLWEQMKAQGQPGFAALFPGVSPPLLGAITADYSAIMWWAEAMAGASQKLAAIRNWFALHSTGSVDDPEFENMRRDLAAHLAKVTATTSEEFGEPWGLIAMDQASGRRATANILITGPKLVRTKERALPATAV